MKCFECGTLMKLERIPRYHDKGTGLPNVYLANITARVCPQCEEREIVIPHVEGLHCVLARRKRKGALIADLCLEFDVRRGEWCPAAG